MGRIARMVALGGLVALAAGEAAAQYYPPPDYLPPSRPYAPPPYAPPPYAPSAPGYYEPTPAPRAARDFGFRCGARAFTPNGPERVICDLDRPGRLGRPCECAPPPPPPGYSPGPYLEGRVIR